MIIKEIELSKEELVLAVTSYLKTQGLDVQVNTVDSVGYPMRHYRVDCEPKPTLIPSVLREPEYAGAGLGQTPAPVAFTPPQE